MAPSRITLLASALLASTVTALPQSLSASTPVSVIVSATATAATSANQWWTPSAASEWDWKTWSQSASLPTANVATSASLLAVVTSSVPYTNGFTSYTSLTDSRGVITGMPAVATNIPTQSAIATVCSGCSDVLSQQSSWSSMVASLYTTSTAAALASANSTLSTATRTSASASSTSTVGFSQSTGAAGKNEIAFLAMVGAIAALL